MELNEWFRRYSARLIELCPPNNLDDFAFRVWSEWGRIESIEMLFATYSQLPEKAAADVIQRQRDGVAGQFWLKPSLWMLIIEACSQNIRWHGNIMLILTRGAGETIMIGEDIAVTILSVTGDLVRIAVNAQRVNDIHQSESDQSLQHLDASKVTNNFPDR
jgi:carbon storage regulator